jgi:hypothetical protein
MKPCLPRHSAWPWAEALLAVVTSLALLSFVLLLFDSVAPPAPAHFEVRGAPGPCADQSACPAANGNEQGQVVRKLKASRRDSIPHPVSRRWSSCGGWPHSCLGRGST